MKYADGTEIRVGDTLVCNLTCVVAQVCPFRMVPGDGGEHVRVITHDGDEHAIYAHAIKRDGWDRKPAVGTKTEVTGDGAQQPMGVMAAPKGPHGPRIVKRGPIKEVVVGGLQGHQTFTVGVNAERIEPAEVNADVSCLVVYPVDDGPPYRLDVQEIYSIEWSHLRQA